MSMANSTLFADGTKPPEWSSSSDSRGTIEILSTCASAMILCSWSAICCNIPSSDSSAIERAAWKCWLTFISFLGPEYLLYIALGQFISARASVTEFRKLGYKQWTMKHGFYADMGGFRLYTTDEDVFPINTRSLLWLIQEGFIDSKQIQEEVMIDVDLIDDRNKADPIVRTIALAQVSWFLLNIFARFRAGYTISTLELTVLGYVIPVMVTHWLWWYKPRDVLTASTIKLGISMKVIQARSGSLNSPWTVNPLDFAERVDHHGTLLYRYWVNSVLGLFRSTLSLFWRRKQQPALERRPRPYRSNNDILDMGNPYKTGWIEVLPTFWYLGIPFIAWNWYFPTVLEQTLWRSACIGMAVTYMGGAAYEFFLISTCPAAIERKKLLQYRARAQEIGRTLAEKQDGYEMSKWQRTKLKWSLRFQRLRQCPLADDPSLDVSLRILIPATVCVAVYTSSRLYILIEDIVGLRRVPEGLYKATTWVNSIPHLG